MFSPVTKLKLNLIFVTVLCYGRRKQISSQAVLQEPAERLGSLHLPLLSFGQSQELEWLSSVESWQDLLSSSSCPGKDHVCSTACRQALYTKALLCTMSGLCALTCAPADCISSTIKCLFYWELMQIYWST